MVYIQEARTSDFLLGVHEFESQSLQAWDLSLICEEREL